MKKPLTTDRMDQIISNLLDETAKQYITETAMLPLILNNDSRQIENLQILDILHQSVLTSLQFGQYRRAVWYLQAFSLACEKIFDNRVREKVIQALRKQHSF